MVAFPSVFTEWGGVRLTALVVPAIQVIMFGTGTTLSSGDFVRVVKTPWAVGVLKSTVAALPANVFSIWMNFSGSILANYWNRRTCKSGR